MIRSLFTPTILFFSTVAYADGLVPQISPSQIQANITTDGNVNAPPESAQATLSPYFYVPTTGVDAEDFPLKKTEVEVDVTGIIADVNIRQIYKNTGEETIEAVYTFPMSTRAAVHDMQLTIGDRVIQAEVQRRDLARANYEKAKQEGKSASLLEQNRPNVFQMNVANILPGDEIIVDLQYTELLVPTEQTYEFMFPTVVGPRFSEGLAANAVDSDKWIANPYLQSGQPANGTVDIDVNIQAPFPVSTVRSPSHDVEVNYASTTEVDIDLINARQNQDFILRYQLAGERIASGLMTYEGDDENFFLAMIEPPANPSRSDILPREYVFIIDISGSMRGFPLEISKSIVREMLKTLRKDDYFNVLLFAGGSQVLSKGKSLPVNEENMNRVQSWLSSASGGGGTRLLPAMKKALELPQREGVSKTMAVITDGYVAVEQEAFGLIQKSLGDANLFTYGIGSSVNRHLIEGMARVGKGDAFVVTSKEHAYKEGARFANYVLNPVLTDIEIAFDGIEVYDVSPIEQPDVFASRPVVVFGKYKGKPTGKLTISGQQATGDYKQVLSFADASAGEENDALALLWARNRITELDDQGSFFRDSSKKDKVTELGLKYNLMTQYTSFVAIDKVKRANGIYESVNQPLEMPAGVPNSALPGQSARLKASGFGSSGAGGFSGGGLGGGYYSSGSVGSTGFGGRKARGRAKTGSYSSRKSFSIVQPDSSSVALGAIEKSLLDKVMARNRARLKYCYERELQKNPKLSGAITVKLTINKDGTVKAVSFVRNTLSKEGDKLSSCVQRQLKRLKFPAASGITIMRYPLKFSPAENK